MAIVGAQDVQGLLFTADGYTLAGSGTLNLTGVSTATPGQSFVNVDRGVGVTIANTLTGTGGAFGLTKVGDGTVTLTGISTYTGPTVVTAGSLVLAGSGRLASAVTTTAAGTFVNAGTLLQGLTNVGTSGNSGTIVGTVDNSGTLTTSGTLSGGLINTGALTASAGRIDGGITNRAGTLTITGPVSSDAALSNLADGTLSVAGSGAFDLGGLLTNAGSVTVASGGRLTAPAGIRNAGSLTIAAGGTIVDALVNTGRVENAGLYNADVTNAAGATLVNTGTLATVSRPVQNAGSLASSGVVSGGLDNTGIARIGGTLAGALTNLGTVLLTTSTTGVTALTNAGLLDLGGTTLMVGLLAGTDAKAVLRNGRLVAGGDSTSSTYAGGIADGTGRTFLTKAGSGTLTLTGISPYSGDTTVAAGTLVANGTLENSPVAVAGGATLGGVGLLGGLDARAGATVAPGATAGVGSLGTLTVAGNVAFAPGSVLEVDATADGRSDGIVATGAATLRGGTVQVTAGPGQYAPRTRYTLLAAAGGLTGQFAAAAANFSFLTPFLSYDANDAYLTLARNDVQFGAVAQTRNQRAVAAAAEAGGVGTRVYDAIAVLSDMQARQAFDGLSGEVHASAVTAQFATAFFVREAILDRLRWGGGGETACGDGLSADPRSHLGLGAPSLGHACARPSTTYAADVAGYAPQASEVDVRLRDPRAVAFWGQGFGSFGSTASDGNAARLDRQTGGFAIGGDARLDAGWRVGMAGGYTATFLDVNGRASSGSIETGYGALYGGGAFGPLQVRLGASYGASSLTTQRSIGAGFGETASARYGGTVAQGFGEVGYRFGSDTGYIEPFVGGAAIRIDRDGFQERGSAVALSAVGRSYDLATSTVGVQGLLQLGTLFGTPTPLLARGYLGYRRAYGDLVPTTSVFLGAGGQAFAATGIPVDRDALVTQAALDWQVTPATTLGVAYQGQVGGRAYDNTVKGGFRHRW